MKKIFFIITSLLILLVTLPMAASCTGTSAPSGPVTLDMVGAFPKGSPVAAPAKYFAEEINRRFGGQLVINWKGGPEVIPTFDQPDALIKGVFDVWYGAPNYWAGVLPGAHVLEVSKYYPADQGPGTEIYDYLVKMYEEVEVRYVIECAGAPDTANFYTYTNKPVQKPEDFAGQKIRVSPLTRQFVEAMGAEPVTMPGGDIYLAMERGVVDGFIWPTWAAFNEMGFQEVAKYYIDHPVYRGPLGINFNQSTWDQLSGDAQDLVIDVAKDTQSWALGWLTGQHDSQRGRAKKAGMEFVKFSQADGQRYVQLSQDALWAYFKTVVSPDRYTKLRQLLGYE